MFHVYLRVEHGTIVDREYRALGNDSWVNFTIVVSRPSDVRSKIQEHHENENFNFFLRDVLLFFVLLLYADDIIIVRLKA